MPIVSSDGQFYQHQPQETYLHSSQPDLSIPGVPQNLHQQSSYVTSEGDNEYSTEQQSGYRRGGPHQSTITEEEVGEEEEEDDYDTAADVRREAEIARLAAQGLRDKDIADELVLSVRTVESHLATTYRKLRITSRRELVDALNATPGPL